MVSIQDTFNKITDVEWSVSSNVASADLIVETVTEKSDTKKKIFEEVEKNAQKVVSYNKFY